VDFLSPSQRQVQPRTVNVREIGLSSIEVQIMGLHHITEDSTTIHYHCMNPACIYHNCAAWESYQQCQAHDIQRFVTIPASEMRERMQGALLQDQLDAIGYTLWIERIQQRVEGKTRQTSRLQSATQAILTE
jgi:hypothetical protein